MNQDQEKKSDGVIETKNNLTWEREREGTTGPRFILGSGPYNQKVYTIVLYTKKKMSYRMTQTFFLFFSSLFFMAHT